MRNSNFDILKGVLIILVIVGHLVHGHMEQSMIRWFIYSFHMPLFIAVAGYMFSSTYNKQVSITQLFSKYKVRLILPWLLAIVLYWLLVNYGDFPDGEKNQSILYNLIRPYFHLWFVSGLMCWIFTTWMAKRLGVSLKTLLIISAFMSVFRMIMIQYKLDSYIHQSAIKEVKDFIFCSYRPQHYLFFVLGLYLKEHPVNVSRLFCVPLIVAGFAGRVVLYYYQSQSALFVIDYFILNVALILFLIKKAEQQAWFNSKPLQWLGINSFGVYLWHQMSLLVVHQIIYWMGDCELWLHYSMDVVLLFIMLGIIYILSKNKYTSAYLIGIKK